MDPNFEGRVFVVANRLPITIEAYPDGNFEYIMSSGGLVSSLRSLAKAVGFKWFGWPGMMSTATTKMVLDDNCRVGLTLFQFFWTKVLLKSTTTVFPVSA